MKNNIITLMKKEFIRFFGDKRLMFTAVLLPGLLIYVMYSLMGSFMGDLTNVDENYIYSINVVNMPASIEILVTGNNFPAFINKFSESDVENLKQQVSAQETDLLVRFPADFDALVAAYDINSGAAPNVEIWSNMARSESAAAESLMRALLDSYENSMSNKFDINASVGEEYQLATESDMFQSYFVFMLPMLLMMFIFVGCQAIAPESIAGEKERGTLGTLLCTPAKRSDMALAKIFSITFFGLLGALGSFLGTMLSLPKIMQIDSASMNLWSAGDYALLLLVTISTLLVFVSVLSLMSAYAKSVKEATSYAMPIMLLSIVCGLSGMITGGASESLTYYFIPVFNSAQCMTAIFTSDVSLMKILVTVGVNVVVMIICTFALTKMFNSEKIVFDK